MKKGIKEGKLELQQLLTHYFSKKGKKERKERKKKQRHKTKTKITRLASSSS